MLLQIWEDVDVESARFFTGAAGSILKTHANSLVVWKMILFSLYTL